MSHDTPALRRATPDDRDAVRGLMADLGYELAPGPAFDRAYADVLFDPRRTMLLAEISGRPVAFVCFSRVVLIHLAGECLVLDELVVEDGARGSGVGRALVQEVLRFAERIGARRVELTTNRKRESYRRGFYVKQGFSEAGSAVMRIERG